MNNDLISREALKEALGEQISNISNVHDFVIFVKLIEHAPTFDLDDFYGKAFRNGEENALKIRGLNERSQGDIRWVDKLSLKNNGDIIDFEGRVVGHIDLEIMKGGAE